MFSVASCYCRYSLRWFENLSANPTQNQPPPLKVIVFFGENLYSVFTVFVKIFFFTPLFPINTPTHTKTRGLLSILQR